MSALLEFQRTLQGALLRDEPFPAGVRARWMIHQHNCRSSLANALRWSFPAVRSLVGEDFFEAMALQFMRWHAPDGSCLDDYGSEFPQFVADFPPAHALSYLSDVARLEWAVNRALHASDAERLEPACLAALDQAALARVCFRPHPAVSVLHVQSPADTIRRAVLEQDDTTMAAIDLRPAPLYLLVEREAAGVEVHRLSAAAARFTERLLAGEPLYEALAGEPSQESSVQAWLAEHLAAGRFVDFIVSTGSDAETLQGAPSA
jgi:hypothetical protein